MKAFWIYTVMRLSLFVGSFALIFGIWGLFDNTVPWFGVFLTALLVSGVGSYFLLARQRQAFAVHVENRAAKATAKIEELRAKEDVD